MENVSTHQDSDQGAIDVPNTLLQDSQRTCTRNYPCLQQVCMVCCTPTDQVCNLDTKLNATSTPTLPASSTQPQPPPNHLVLKLTSLFQDWRHTGEWRFWIDQYQGALHSSPEIWPQLHELWPTNLRAVHKLTMQLITSAAPPAPPPPHRSGSSGGYSWGSSSSSSGGFSWGSSSSSNTIMIIVKLILLINSVLILLKCIILTPNINIHVVIKITL